MFSVEVELAAPVVTWLQAKGGSCIAHEVQVDAGIPDLVAGIGPSSKLRNRRRQAAPILDAAQLAVLDFCRVSRTIDELYAWSPYAPTMLERRALSPLVERQLLALTSEGRYQSRKNPKDPFLSIVAVELKLAATARGFSQAFSYRIFADTSYFAIPASKVAASTVQRATQLGIGLLSVRSDSCDEVVEPSVESFATAGRRRMASERVLAASRRKDSRLAGSPARNFGFS